MQNVKNKNLKFVNVLKSEFIKLTGKNLFKIITLIIFSLTIVTFVVSLYIFKDGSSSLSMLPLISNPTIVFLGVLFIVLVTEEYSSGTGLITYTFVPNRNKVIFAKLILLLCIYAIVMSILFALTFASSLILKTIYGYNVNFDFELVSIVKMSFPLMFNLLFAFSIAILVKQISVALVLYYVLPIVTIVATTIQPIASFAKWISLDFIIYTFPSNFSIYQRISSIILWILLPIIIGLYRNNNMDIQ